MNPKFYIFCKIYVKISVTDFILYDIIEEYTNVKFRIF